MIRMASMGVGVMCTGRNEAGHFLSLDIRSQA